MKESLVPNHKGQPCVRNFEHPDAEELTRFVRNVISEMGGDPDAPFKPVAYYNSVLERIIVVTEDCSHTEVDVGPWLILHQRNHFDDEKTQPTYVGFSVRKEALDFIQSCFAIAQYEELQQFMTDWYTMESDPRVFGALSQVAIPLLEDHNINVVELP